MDAWGCASSHTSVDDTSGPEAHYREETGERTYSCRERGRGRGRRLGSFSAIAPAAPTGGEIRVPMSNTNHTGPTSDDRCLRVFQLAVSADGDWNLSSNGEHYTRFKYTCASGMVDGFDFRVRRRYQRD